MIHEAAREKIPVTPDSVGFDSFLAVCRVGMKFKDQSHSHPAPSAEWIKLIV